MPHYPHLLDCIGKVGLNCIILIFAKQLPIRRIGRRVLVHRKHLEDFARHDHVDSCKGGVMAAHANKLDVQRYERRERIHDAERKGLKTSERREVLA